MLTLVAQGKEQGDGGGVCGQLQVQRGAFAHKPPLGYVVQVRVEQHRGQRAVPVTHQKPDREGERETEIERKRGFDCLKMFYIYLYNYIISYAICTKAPSF